MKTTWLTNVHETQAARVERELSQHQTVFVSYPKETEYYSYESLMKMGVRGIYRVDEE